MTYSEAVAKFGEYGEILEVRHPIVSVAGLPGVTASEMVIFEDETIGQVMSFNRDIVTIMALSNNILPVGLKAARLGTAMSVPVGDDLLGKVIDPIGTLLIFKRPLPVLNWQALLDVAPLPITARSRVDKTLLTGTSLVDLLIPLGRGQRELVVGDRKTGKTSFLFNVMKTQCLAGTIVIYAAIGKPSQEIHKIIDYINNEGINDKTVVVASTSSDVSSHIYLTPFTAMALAEFWRNSGHDVLVILDDLSTHAKYFRELSLLARKFPGHDSYPGDSFYTHARLLERAGKYKTGSISCLAVAETTSNDLTDYIVSNLIGITDGHILFDSQLYLRGNRPAINALLSVSRVGHQTCNHLHQEISQTLTAFLVEYERVLDFSHFGEDTSESVVKTLRRGERLLAFLNQAVEIVMPLPVQLTFIGMLWNDFFTDLQPARISGYRETLTKAFNEHSHVSFLIDTCVAAEDFKALIAFVSDHRVELLAACGIKS
ncbi:MAG: hypothetical protein NT141_01310 [candidate division WWE3 bacterium]|nr:hypothetical protein [candidate division WWE3 bacterium]